MGDRPVATYEYTSAVAVAASLTAPGGGLKVLSVGIKISVAPTTSENLTITVDSNTGAAYDQTILTNDLSVTSATSVFLEGPFYLAEGDVLDVTYANTDTRTFGIVVAYSTGQF